jgi:hypothetical protein
MLMILPLIEMPMIKMLWHYVLPGLLVCVQSKYEASNLAFVSLQWQVEMVF